MERRQIFNFSIQLPNAVFSGLLELDAVCWRARGCLPGWCSAGAGGGRDAFLCRILRFSHVRKLVQMINQQSYFPTNHCRGLALTLLRLCPSVAAAHWCSGFYSLLSRLSPSFLISVTFIQIKLGKLKGKCKHFKKLVLLC